ncbi:Aste57867_23396 [Aphanomyces stellatus]|uniref:Aste57867_23396 protein n=1 Tax=Aphanomyces stellatus TaxID=120398 RepID=A0A485LP93_9STRA|nr:hypothetical protein As57867_023325 [Aphanomyces stellatus]VFU00042.1 Aste57867_23396 [Aphanomyces stellatus]
MERPVWFALVDGQGKGKAYNGTTAIKVKIKSTSDIDDFREAVKDKFDRQGDDLKGIVSSKLHVFKNRDTFVNNIQLGGGEMIEHYGELWDDPLLVVVSSSSLSSDDTFFKKIEETVERMFKKQKKRECIAFSGISTSKLNKVTKGLRIIVVSGNEPKLPKANLVRAFDWDPNRREDEQVAEYLLYLHCQLDATLKQMGLCLLDATQHPAVLAIEDDRFEFDLNCTADVLILDDLGDNMAKNVRHLNGLRLVMELKKDLTTEYSKKENQALVELIAANVRAPDLSPVVVLTDLDKKMRAEETNQCIQIHPLDPINKQPQDA